MLTRTCLAMLVLGTVVLALPNGWSPADTARANCIQIEGVDDCINPCNKVVSVYNTVRKETGTQEETPPIFCLE